MKLDITKLDPDLRLRMPEAERKLVAAQGATIAADPTVRGAISSIKSGQEPQSLLAKTHSGLIRAKLEEAKAKHEGKYGVSQRTAGAYMNSLSR